MPYSEFYEENPLDMMSMGQNFGQSYGTGLQTSSQMNPYG
jgi:hypothetical protein